MTMVIEGANFYSGAGIDRAGHLRKDEAWQAERRTDPATRIVPVWRSMNLVVEGDSPWAVLSERQNVPQDLVPEIDGPFLGVNDGIAYYAQDVSALSEDDAASLAARLHPNAVFVDLRKVGALLMRFEGSLLAYARGLLFWRQRHGFCGVCGHRNASVQSGHVLACTNPDCGAMHFPRSDPAAIMLVTDGNRCLLGRQSRWVAGMYSTLAGFVEPGESMEDAVAREVFEESGIRVGKVRYHSSQPWPFPASLMVGFYAEALSRDIRIDQDELEDARWFTADEVRRLPELGFSLPRPDSIARRLIETWLAEQV